MLLCCLSHRPIHLFNSHPPGHHPIQIILNFGVPLCRLFISIFLRVQSVQLRSRPCQHVAFPLFIPSSHLVPYDRRIIRCSPLCHRHFDALFPMRVPNLFPSDHHPVHPFINSLLFASLFVLTSVAPARSFSSRNHLRRTTCSLRSTAMRPCIPSP